MRQDYDRGGGERIVLCVRESTWSRPLVEEGVNLAVLYSPRQPKPDTLQSQRFLHAGFHRLIPS